MLMKFLKTTFLLLSILTLGVYAQQAWLAEEGVAVFYPADFNAVESPPSLALTRTLEKGGALPADWKMRPSFSVVTNRYDSLDMRGDHDRIPRRYRAAFASELDGVDLYGTGEQLGDLRRNGTVVPVYNRDNFAYSKGPNLYQAHPWVLGVRPDGSSFGIIADTSARGEIDLRGGRIEFDFEVLPFRVIVIKRDSPQAVLKTLGSLCGTIAMPPKWALGYHQCRYSYMNEGEARSIIDNFRNRKLPCDVIWFDIDYMDKYKVFTFDSERYPNPQRMNDYAHARNFHTVWMIDPGVKVEAGYPIYDAIRENNIYLEKPAADQMSAGLDVEVSASSNPGDAGLAIDDELASGWRPDAGGTEWLAIDLGAGSEILQIDIQWEQDVPADYRVELSSDGDSWSEVVQRSEPTGPGRHCILSAKQTQARHLRIVCEQAPGQSSAIYDVRLNGETFNPDLSAVPDDMYTANVWPGRCVFPDFTMQRCERVWRGFYQPFMASGIDGVWNDMNEPAIFGGNDAFTAPDEVRMAGGLEIPTGILPPGEHVLYHNVYGMLMARATRKGVMNANPGKRPFVLTRANYLGGHRYAATWTGDNVASREHMLLATPMSINMGLSGQPFVGPDLGGFAGDPSPELFAEWISVGAFYPFMRGHAAKGSCRKEPWAFGPETEAAARIALNRRYRLIDYIYTLYFKACTKGQPIMRPVFFADPDDTALRREQNAFLFGPDILVVPRWAENAALPRGDWKEFMLLGNDYDNRFQPKMKLRPGAIVPARGVVQYAMQETEEPMTFYINLDENGEAFGQLYEDAGDGWGYRRGEFCLTSYKASRGADGGLDVRIVDRKGSLKIPPRMHRIGLVEDDADISWLEFRE